MLSLPGSVSWLTAGLAVSIFALAGALVLFLREFRLFKQDEGNAEPPEAPARPTRGRVAAVYEGGVFKPHVPLDLPEHTEVRLIVETGATGTPAASRALSWSDVRLAFSRLAALSPASVLFALGLLAYAVTRLWALDRFPIYFFADEATHAVLAEELIRRGFRTAQGNFLPLYFEAAGMRWTPLLSVYVHVVSVALFGKSILVTRATSAVVSILGAAAAGLILKLVFRARYWWAGPLLLAVVPAWFLHSRTGFETVMMSAFFACFLLAYLLYRTRSPRYLFAALFFGAATFYTYSNGQMIMAAAGSLLLLSDLRYHLRHWRTTLLGALFLALLMAPVVAFRLHQPDSLPQHLRAIDSYWFRAIPLQDKLAEFVRTYLYGLSPQYWFFPNTHDLVRHRMAGYAHLGLGLLPLVLVGAGLCLRHFRSSPHRTVILAALATPVGAALVGVSITRVLAFVIPATLLAGLGLDWLLGRAGQRVSHALLSLGVFAILAAGSAFMLRDALINGPLWYRDYGLYGMQYGAKQLFEGAIPDYLARDPNAQLRVSSTWANGADTFIRFFLPPQVHPRVQMLNVDHYLEQKRDLNSNIVLVMTPAEYEQARSSPKFARVDPELVIDYPDGSPGFYFVRLAYAEDVDQIFAAEREARRRLVEGQAAVGGQEVSIRHSQLEAGQLSDLFDHDTFTLVRGREANPLVFELYFAEPRTIRGLACDFGTMDFALNVMLYSPGEGEPVMYSSMYRGLPPDPHVELEFDKGPESVTQMRLEIQQLGAGDTAKIHVRELELR